MAEWLKAPAWKACILLKVSRVRIPFSPPVLIVVLNFKYNINFFNKLLQRYHFFSFCYNNLTQKVAPCFFFPKEDVCKYID